MIAKQAVLVVCAFLLPLSGCMANRCIRQTQLSPESAIRLQRIQEERILASSELKRIALENVNRSGPAECLRSGSEREKESCEGALKMARSMIELAHLNRVSSVESVAARKPAGCQ